MNGLIGIPQNTKHFFNLLLLDFCSVVNLNYQYLWRINNPDSQNFMWLKPNGSVKSRMDFWLVSDISPGLELNTSISAAPLTSHCQIKL